MTMKLYRFTPFTKNGKEGSILCIPMGEADGQAVVINRSVAGLKLESGYFIGTPNQKTNPDGTILRSVNVEAGSEMDYLRAMQIAGLSVEGLVKAAFLNEMKQAPKPEAQKQKAPEFDGEAPF